MRSDDGASDSDYLVETSPELVFNLLLAEFLDDLQGLRLEITPDSVKLNSLIVGEYVSTKLFEDNNPSDSNISYINDTDNGTTIEKEKISYNSATTFLDKNLQLSDNSQ